MVFITAQKYDCDHLCGSPYIPGYIVSVYVVLCWTFCAVAHIFEQDQFETNLRAIYRPPFLISA